MSTPPKVFRADPKQCVACGEVFYPAFPKTVACCVECWRLYKLSLHRGYDGSSKTGPSSRSRRKYATPEEAKESRRAKARERWQKIKLNDPERYKEINRNHSRRQYWKHRQKMLEKSRKRSAKVRMSHSELKALSELLTLNSLARSQK